MSENQRLLNGARTLVRTELPGLFRHGPYPKTRGWLLWLSLLSLANCRSTPDERLTPLPTDRLARLQEWYVDGRADLTTARLIDTLHWLAVDQNGYAVVHAIDSRYAYDEQNRLSQQTVSGHRFRESGPERSILMHQYQYTASQLTVSTIADRLDSWQGPTRFSWQQVIPLNQQGLVEQQPQLGNMYTSGDNIFAGVSELFHLCLHIGLQDSLRRYDDHGYLIGATTKFIPAWSEPYQLTQSIVSGNVVNRQLQPVGSKPTVGTTERWLMQYDRSRPTIPNPHQFSGSISRDLPTKTLYYAPNQPIPRTDEYRYDYDTQGRVVRYYISRQEQGGSRLHTVGKLTYQP